MQASTTKPPTVAVSTWIAGARPRTLPAAIVPVAVGAACAVGVGPQVVWWRVGVALAVSLLLQVGVNFANDYSDGVRGTDDARVGPVRLVAAGLATPRAVKVAAIASMALAAIAGLALAATTSWWLLAVGVAAIVAAWGYTGGPRPYGYLGLGELFVFVFFGLTATVGTTFVAIEQVPSIAWIAACGVGCLACGLLVANNLRDIPTDSQVGKRTLAVRFGDRMTRRFYVALILGSFAAVDAVAIAGRPWALIAMFAAIVANGPIRRVLKGAKGRDLVAVLVATGNTQIAYGVLLTVGIALG